MAVTKLDGKIRYYLTEVHRSLMSPLMLRCRVR